jgi:hypothetical protein
VTGVVVPPPPAGLPPGPELVRVVVAESGLLTPFVLHGLPIVAEDRNVIRSLAAKVTADEGRWLTSAFTAFFEHGRRGLALPAPDNRAGYQAG